MIRKRQMIATLLTGVMVLSLASPTLAKGHQDQGRGIFVGQKNQKNPTTTKKPKNPKDRGAIMQLLIPVNQLSEELKNLEEKVNLNIEKDLQSGNYSQVKIALNDYVAVVDQIESAGKAEQTVKADWQKILSDLKQGNNDTIQNDLTTLQVDIKTAVSAIQTAVTGLQNVINDLQGSTAGTPSPTQTKTPTITGTLMSGDTSVRGTAEAGASIVLSVNGIAQPAVTADENGNWTVIGLTLATGDAISVTAQVSGDAISKPATATVEAANLQQTAIPTITGTPIAGDTSVTGKAEVGASIILSINGTAQPAVTTDESGNWSVNGLTLATGDAISVTAQVSGKAISSPATATVS